MSSILKVDTIQDQSGNNIINESGNVITIGASGDTINIVGTLQNNGGALPGDITSVVAGTGLSGGATSGVATLNIEAAQPTITSLGTITTFRSTGIDDNSNALAITIDSSESLGLGTTTPFNSRPGAFTISNEAPTIYMEDTNGSGDKVGQILYQNAELSYSTGSRNGTNTSGSTEHFRINSSGNVGIGTSSPAEKLSVSGNIDTSGSILTSTNNSLKIISGGNATNAGSNLTLYGGTNADAGSFRFRNGTTVTTNVTAAGQIQGVSLGPSTPTFSFTSDTNTGMTRPTTDTLTLVTGGSERMRINSNGNIGIGTTNSTQAKVYIDHTGDVDDNGLYVYSNIGQTVPLLRVLQDGAGSNQPAVHVRNDGSAGGILIEKGTSGATANTGHNQVIADGSANSGFSILSGNTSNGAVCFGDDGNNCIGYVNYAHNGNHLDFGVNGSEKMRIDSSGNVGIGTSSPSCALDVNGGSANGNVFKTTTSGDNNYLAIDNTSTGGQEWVLNSSGNGSGNGGGAFAIQGPDSNTPRLLINSSGKVGIGETSPLGLLHIKSADTSSSVSANADELVIEGTRSGMTFLAANNNYSYINFGDSGGSGSGSIRYGHPDNDFKFVTNGADQWTLDSSGNWLPAATDHGIYLGVTSAAAGNLLNDYEEGTWTPTFSHGITSVGYLNQAGKYTKIGDIVYFDLNLQTNAGTGANTRLRIGGFPFTANSAGGSGTASIGYVDNSFVNSTSTNLPTMFKEPSSLDFYKSDGGQYVGTDLNDPDGINIYISGVYKTA